MLVRTCFIAITGSVGKTTAKEMLAGILASQGRVHRTHANQSGGRLVVLNVLRVRPWHRYAVLEVSGAPPGTLDWLAPLIRPDVVLQLGVNYTHSREFADLEARASEKGKLCAALGDSGIAVLNGEDPLIRKMETPGKSRRVSFGLSPACSLWADQVTSRWPSRLAFTAHLGEESLRVKSRLVGKHWLPSVLGPLTVGLALGLDFGRMVESVGQVSPFPGRLQPVRLSSGAVVLRDDYNSSIPVLKASLEVLREASCPGRKILVIRDFSDFPGHRRHRLRHLASIAAGIVDGVALIGEAADYGLRRFAEAGLEAQNLYSFGTLKEAAEGLAEVLAEGDLVLVKARTTDHLSRIVHAMEANAYAMLVGSYTTVDLSLGEVPPGLVAHREWSRQNGHFF